MSTENYGRYQLLKRIATGGMAQIYLARQTGLEGFEKLLVVKRILAHLAENQDFVRMFLDEARIAARLNHPNIVQIFDLGAQDGTFFIAMEYIHGEDVRRVWKRAANRGRVMPVPLVCRVMMEACAGLDYAHKKADTAGKPLGIVHRDISPQNILVTFEGGVKVVDFGIAKAADQATVTRSGVLKGKYSYMSPEQANGEKLDRRSDIFALGIVLHELLTGNRLFKRANDIQTLNAVSECNIPPPSLLSAAIPPDLDRIVMKALQKDPANRFQDAAELQAALEGWLLAHQLPSSSAHLAAFMQELYADRLAEEKAAGQVIVEETGEGPRGAASEDSPRPPPPPGDDGAISLTGSEKLTELGIPRPADLESTLRAKAPARPPSGARPALRPPSSELRISGAARPSTDLRQSASNVRAGVDPRSELKQGGARAAGETKPASNPELKQSGARAAGEAKPVSNPELRQSGAARAAGEGKPSAVRAELRQSGAGPAGQRNELRFMVPEPGEDSLAATVTTEAGMAPWHTEGMSVSVTYGRKPRRRVLPWVTSAVSLAVMAAVAALVWARSAEVSGPALANLRIRTEPPGAVVMLDGRLVVGEKTPLTVPNVTGGRHQLQLSLPGYVDLRTTIDVPSEGEVELPLLPLAPAPPAPVEEARAQVVTLTVRSQPLGALVIVGERELGRTPHTLQALPGDELIFRVELAGYEPVTRAVRVKASDSEEQIVLQRALETVRHDRSNRGDR